MADSPAPAVYRVAEVAALLAMGRRQTYEAIKRGDIPCKKLGGSVRCPKVLIHAWLDGETANGKEVTSDERPTHGRTSLEEAVAGRFGGVGGRVVGTDKGVPHGD